MIRVLHVVSRSYPGKGGYIVRTENILDYIIDSQIKIDVCGSIFIKQKNHLDKGARFVHNNRNYYQLVSQKHFKIINFINHFYGIRYLYHNINIFINSLLIIKNLNIKKYDIIHAHSTFRNGLSALIVAKLYKKKLIYDIHSLSNNFFIKNSIKNWFEKLIEQLIIRKSDYVFVIDEHVKLFLIKEFNLKCDRVTTVPNGINSDKFKYYQKNKELLKKYNIPENKIIVGLDNSKELEGFKFIINNRFKIIQEFPEIHFIVFGSKDTLKNENFTFLPIILLSDMPEHYNLIDGFILPRIKTQQTDTVTPLKLLEIMCCEKPVLVSNVKGLTSCIENEKTGYIFNEGNLQSFIFYFKKLIHSIKKGDNIGHNARESIMHNKDWYNSSNKIVKCYNNLV